MNLNYKKLLKYSLIMFIGIVLVIYGVLSLAFDTDSRAMTDQEIINRARELGMVDLNEAYAKWSDEYKLKLEREFEAKKESQNDKLSDSKKVTEKVTETDSDE